MMVRQSSSFEAGPSPCPLPAYRERVRMGRGTVLLVAFVASVAFLIGMILLLMKERKGESRSAKLPLMVYCAAGLREPMQAVADDYHREFGVEVRCSYGAS